MGLPPLWNPSPVSPPGSFRLLERALTFTDILHFLGVFLSPRSPLSPLVPCFDASPYSNIYMEIMLIFVTPPSLSPSPHHSIAFLEQNQRITRWTYLSAEYFALGARSLIFCLLNVDKE